MRYDFHDTKRLRRFILAEDVSLEANTTPRSNHDLIQFNWNNTEVTIRIEVDGVKMELPPHHITTFTYLHHLSYPTSLPIRGMLFNRNFYCIADHDAEIGCNGILFFGTQELPVIALDHDHRQKLELLWKVMIDEFGQADNVQGEMLQMLLKRFIILCTRLARQQLITKDIDQGQLDIVRKYNVLVDMHFREKKKVQDYAELLNRSPKTLANLFAKYGSKSPLQLIQERTVLEAKRLLFYTDKQVQEVAFELGFDEPGHFTKYFKKYEGQTPLAFKQSVMGR